MANMSNKNRNETNSTIYLDYNATTPLAEEVIECISSSLKYAWGNPSSNYNEGQIAKKLIANARNEIAKSINSCESEIIFTSGGTESNNWTINTCVNMFDASQNKNCAEPQVTLDVPHIITSTVEHPSILNPLDNLVKKGRAEVTKVKIDKKTGDISPLDVVKAIKPNTCLVTIMMANNETGTIMNIKEICNMVKKKSNELGRVIYVHTDAAQTLGKIAVDVVDLNVDFLTIVGHKFYGPRIGALFIRNLDNHPHFKPIFFGGGQEKGWRAGTENTPMIAGLGCAARLASTNLSIYEQNMRKTRDYLEKQLQVKFGDKIHINGGSSDRLPNTCNVSVVGPGLEGFNILQRVKGFSCSTGSACHSNKCKPSHVLLEFHVGVALASNAIRISTGRSTTMSDIDKVIDELIQVIAHLEK